MCTGNTCGGTYSTDRYGGTCDPDGCDFNPYRMGVTNFYGPGETIDTSSPFTVVTQFLTNDGTSTGTLSEIKRFYVQGGKVIGNPQSTIVGVTGNSITDSWCNAQKTAFGDTNDFSKHGGMAGMGAGLADGMVLVMSLWDDHASDMLWLDSTYPTNATSTTPGAKRGTCDISSGDPSTVESTYPNAYVIYSNIKTGPLNSTFTGGTTSSSSTTTTTSKSTSTSSSSKTTTTSVTTTTTSSGSSGTGAAHWAQCGGNGWTGPTTCVSPYTCTKQNDWYSQCL
jgi:cellulose 1,4-beta-cellobiosidase